jgi:hypothetical protein
MVILIASIYVIHDEIACEEPHKSPQSIIPVDAATESDGTAAPIFAIL